MLVDFSLVAMDQILNQAAKTQYMLGGMVKIPLLMRAIYGAGTSSGSTHSETLYSLFAHMPGLKVIVPSNPYDAKGLLVAALRDENPKVFFEHRLLYRMKGEVPEDQYVIPLGEANTVKEGTDITVVATGMMVHRALEAAEELKDESISLEVIDPRTIVPLDTKSILSSIEKTSRLIIVDEDYRNCSFSSEVAALAADEGYKYLSAPVKRITTPNVPIPYNPKLEKHILPDASKIISTAQKLMK
jgi:pyruvate dehydrogenase E1 component beta subunit